MPHDRARWPNGRGIVAIGAVLLVCGVGAPGLAAPTKAELILTGSRSAAIDWTVSSTLVIDNEVGRPISVSRTLGGYEIRRISDNTVMAGVL